MMSNYIHTPTPSELALIRTTPGTTSTGKPFDAYVSDKLASGKWRLECVRAETLGLSRLLEIFRASRNSPFIRPWTRTSTTNSYCPGNWAELGIGSGPCGLRCRACFLLLTHRTMKDPSRHLLYDNTSDCEQQVRKWLQKPDRQTLGLGIDSSDSLLYEGVTGHARRLIPIFAEPKSNPHGVKLLLLTKSTNVGYLRGLPTRNIIMSFSLNPEPIADLWEGKFDDGVRVTPPVFARLRAALLAQAMGFEVRWRVDPIFAVEGWQQLYATFFNEAAAAGQRPTRITMGTYRQVNPAMATFSRGWGQPPMEVTQTGLVKEGDHYHLPEDDRVAIYKTLTTAIRSSWKGTGHMPVVALCKEPKELRRKVGLLHGGCNCSG